MRIESVESPISLVLESKTGLPTSITKNIDGKAVTQSISCSLELEVNGSERRAQLEVLNTSTQKRLRTLKLLERSVRFRATTQRFLSSR